MNKTINPTPTCSKILRTKKRNITKDFQRILEIMNMDKKMFSKGWKFNMFNATQE